MSDSNRLVFLQHGLVVPREAFDLVLEVERKGIALALDGADVLVTGENLQPDDIEALRRLKPHVQQLLRYVADDRHLFDRNLPQPDHGPIMLSRPPS